MRKYLLGMFMLVLQALSITEIYSQNLRGNTAHIFGILQNMGEQGELYDISEYGELMFSNIKAKFYIDNQGLFSLKIDIDEPTYFRLGRNILYLSAGDSLNVFIDRNDPALATFKGIGETANRYLRYTLYPHAGSYLDAGTNIIHSFEETWRQIELKSKQRELELKNLTNVSKKFKQIESGRIKAGLINSLKSYKGYAKLLDTTKTFKLLEGFNTQSPSLFKKLCTEFMNPDFLCLEVYRKILPLLQPYQKVNSNSISLIEDWQNARNIAISLSKESNKDALKDLGTKIILIKSKPYRTILKNDYTERLQFGEGSIVLPFYATNQLGEIVNIEKFKGKVIYIDFWATWCGPCISELPNLDNLQKHFSEDTSIVFLSVSVDTDRQEWINFVSKKSLSGNQWNTHMSNLSTYFIGSVPRYIIIGKNFKIKKMIAVPPSDNTTVSLLQDLLKERCFSEKAVL